MQLKHRKSLALFAVMALVVALALPQMAFAETSSSTLAAGSQATAQVSAEAKSNVKLAYKVHYAAGKWQKWKAMGKTAGTGSSSNPIDALALNVKSNLSGSIQYQAYVKGSGWQAGKTAKKVAGKIARSSGVEAIRVVLTGNLSRYYDVSYRVKTQGGSSWQGWVANGSVAGKARSFRSLTALQVKLTKKSKVASSPRSGIVGVRYRVKARKTGWLPWLSNGATAGKASDKKYLTAITLKADKGIYSGGIQYQIRQMNGTWKAAQKDGKIAGSASGIGGIRIRLYGEMAKKYDVMYRTKVQGVGWKGWSINNGISGTKGKRKHIKAIQVVLVRKGTYTGWVCTASKWRYCQKGKIVKGKWVKVSKSPIDKTSTGTQYYWIDNKGYLAVNRLINPSNALDKGAGYKAYATINGYVFRSTTQFVAGGWYTIDGRGAMTPLKGGTTKYIERYVKWAIGVANDNSHGYSQKYRWGPDYDCSSLVVAALDNTGFEVGEAVWTGNLRSELTKYGFVWRTNFNDLRRGDILLVHNSSRQHTEIYVGNNMTVGAHIAENGTVHGKSGDQTGHEIDVGPYYSIWEGYLRFVG